MAGFSTYLAQSAINHYVRRQAQSVPAGMYLALFVADPTDDNVTANEVSGAWYARQSVAAWSAPVGTASSTANSNTITFNAVTGTQVTVSHWGLYDAVSGGNLLYSGALPTAKVLNVDDIFFADPGDLVLDFQ